MNDLDDSIDQAPLLSLVSAPVSAPASASAPRTHKKQATTHFKNYKASTKKADKIARDELKVKIAILANDLFTQNKIDRPLYNKLYNFSIGAARLPTLQSTYSNLKTYKQANAVVPKKHFNQKMKQVKINKKFLNTVYLKYEQHEKMEAGGTHQTDQESVFVKNHTLEVKGDEEDIRREIKDFITYVLNMFEY